MTSVQPISFLWNRESLKVLNDTKGIQVLIRYHPEPSEDPYSTNKTRRYTVRPTEVVPRRGLPLLLKGWSLIHYVIDLITKLKNFFP